MEMVMQPFPGSAGIVPNPSQPSDRSMRSWSCRRMQSSIRTVLLQCLFDRFGSVFPQCGLMVFPGVVIVSR